MGTVVSMAMVVSTGRVSGIDAGTVSGMVSATVSSAGR